MKLIFILSSQLLLTHNAQVMKKFKTYSFENLQVWKEARIFGVWIYKLTSKFPPEEKFGMVAQLRKSSCSIPSNLAEGSSRKSLKDQARFSEISFGSLLESLNHLIMSNDLGFINEDDLVEGRLKIDSIGTMLNSLRDSQLKRMENNL